MTDLTFFFRSLKKNSVYDWKDYMYQTSNLISLLPRPTLAHDVHRASFQSLFFSDHRFPTSTTSISGFTWLSWRFGEVPFAPYFSRQFSYNVRSNISSNSWRVMKYPRRRTGSYPLCQWISPWCESPPQRRNCNDNNNKFRHQCSCTSGVPRHKRWCARA